MPPQSRPPAIDDDPPRKRVKHVGHASQTTSSSKPTTNTTTPSSQVVAKLSLINKTSSSQPALKLAKNNDNKDSSSDCSDIPSTRELKKRAEEEEEEEVAEAADDSHRRSAELGSSKATAEGISEVPEAANAVKSKVVQKSEGSRKPKRESSHLHTIDVPPPFHPLAIDGLLLQARPEDLSRQVALSSDIEKAKASASHGVPTRPIYIDCDSDEEVVPVNVDKETEAGEVASQVVRKPDIIHIDDEDEGNGPVIRPDGKPQSMAEDAPARLYSARLNDIEDDLSRATPETHSNVRKVRKAGKAKGVQQGRVVPQKKANVARQRKHVVKQGRRTTAEIEAIRDGWSSVTHRKHYYRLLKEIVSGSIPTPDAIKDYTDAYGPFRGALKECFEKVKERNEKLARNGPQPRLGCDDAGSSDFAPYHALGVTHDNALASGVGRPSHDNRGSFANSQGIAASQNHGRDRNPSSHDPRIEFSRPGPILQRSMGPQTTSRAAASEHRSSVQQHGVAPQTWFQTEASWQQLPYQQQPYQQLPYQQRIFASQIPPQSRHAAASSGYFRSSQDNVPQSPGRSLPQRSQESYLEGLKPKTLKIQFSDLNGEICLAGHGTAGQNMILMNADLPLPHNYTIHKAPADYKNDKHLNSVPTEDKWSCTNCIDKRRSCSKIIPGGTYNKCQNCKEEERCIPHDTYNKNSGETRKHKKKDAITSGNKANTTPDSEPSSAVPATHSGPQVPARASQAVLNSAVSQAALPRGSSPEGRPVVYSPLLETSPAPLQGYVAVSATWRDPSVVNAGPGPHLHSPTPQSASQTANPASIGPKVPDGVERSSLKRTLEETGISDLNISSHHAEHQATPDARPFKKR